MWRTTTRLALCKQPKFFATKSRCGILESLSRQLTSNAGTLPCSARVVVCGGGVVGSSVAYHLAELGWKDVVLLEQGVVGCGTTFHAAGLIGVLRPSRTQTALCQYSAQLYKQLDEQGYSTGWKSCGALNLARTKDRLTSYQRALNRVRDMGIEGELLSPEEVKEKLPLLNTEDLLGGLWLPHDGSANPTDVTSALVKKAKENGVTVLERVEVHHVYTQQHKVKSVYTSEGIIDCQYFVNCAGQWAHSLGKLCEPPVRVPLHSCEHYYIITKDVEGVDNMMPVIRDFDGHIYLREWNGGLVGGGFEPEAKPCFHEGIPKGFEHQLLQEDWDHFHVLLEQLLHRVPAMNQAQVIQLVNGPESFTPDSKPILGECPEIKNYFVAAGMNSGGISFAGGVGKYLAEWIVNGEAVSKVDLWSMDIRRFVDMHNNRKFLKERVKETLGNQAEISYWDTEMATTDTGRNLRTSTIYTRMENDAVFGQGMGYERPLYFNSSMGDEETPELMSVSRRDSAESYDFVETSEGGKKGTFSKPKWFDKVKLEYWACREGVCLIDMSTFTKFELRSAGREVVNFLQYVCSNDVDRPVGTVVHTGMQNERGGYENDCSVVRLAENHYFMISPTAQQTRSYAWLRDHLPSDGSVQLTDMTSMYTAINVLGPKAEELLTELTDTSLDKQHFLSMSLKEIDVGQASGIKAMRLTHSGEDGWTLYIPSEYALHVYDSLMSVGKNYGIRNAGYYALRALRTEKFFAYWGTDLTPWTTPLECGREYRIKFHSGGDFIGREALEKQRKEGIKKKLVQFMLEDHDNEKDLWPWGAEPIYRNGRYCGLTTSTAYGFTLDRQVCLGYVADIEDNGNHKYISTDFILKDAKFEIEIAGKRYPAKAGIYPPKLASAGLIFNSKSNKSTI